MVEFPIFTSLALKSHFSFFKLKVYELSTTNYKKNQQKLITYTKILSQASHLEGCLRICMWDFKFTYDKFPAKRSFPCFTQENCFLQTLHDKIPLTVSLQTGAAIKFRQCSSLLVHKLPVHIYN